MTPKQNADRVMRKHGKLFRGLLKEAQQLPSDEHGRRRVVVIVDKLASKVAEQAACKKGCSHCCYQAVAISQWEAQRISEFSGVPMGQVHANALRDNIVAEFSGVACPFLKDDFCTIYDVRPMACRMHFNMSDDPSLCDIKNNPGASVPMFNFLPMEFAAATLLVELPFADIRNFFP